MTDTPAREPVPDTVSRYYGRSFLARIGREWLNAPIPPEKWPNDFALPSTEPEDND